MKPRMKADLDLLKCCTCSGAGSLLERAVLKLLHIRLSSADRRHCAIEQQV